MEKDKVATIKRIRRHFSAWGVDTSDMTDDEVERGVVKVHESLSAFGCSVQECVERLMIINNVGIAIELPKPKPQPPEIDLALDASFSAEVRELKKSWKKLVLVIAKTLYIDKLVKWLNDKLKLRGRFSWRNLQ